MQTIFTGSSLEIAGNIAEATTIELNNLSDSDYTFQTYSIQSTRDEVSVTGSGVLINCQEIKSAFTQYLEIQNACQDNPSESVSFVIFDPTFTAMIQRGLTNPEQQPKIRVIVSPTSPIAGSLYTASKSLKGFVVRELNAQNVGATFDWMVVFQYPKIGESINLNEISAVTPTPSPTETISPSPTPTIIETPIPTETTTPTPTETPQGESETPISTEIPTPSPEFNLILPTTTPEITPLIDTTTPTSG